MKFRKYISVALLGSTLILGSCVKDLEQEPIVGATSTTLYKDFNNYPLLLSKLYGCLAVGGQAGDGEGDIADIDGGFSNYMRLLFYMQNITTDEAVIGWNDGSLPTMHKMTWTASNEFINAMYYRLYAEIAFCNDFIKNTTDDKLAANGIAGNQLAEAKYMRAEAKFLRAQSYYHLLDLFGNVSKVTENTSSTEIPPRITRLELFSYVESELLAAVNDLKAPKSNDYGRADQAAAWSLLAKLYLNARVYTGSERNNDVITYCNKVIASGYSLKPNYGSLFMADNNLNNPEQIFSVNYDGMRTKTYGGTTFMVHAAIGGTMNYNEFGVNGGWGGLRTTKSFVNLFASNDTRGRFYTSGQNLEINDLGTFTDGYAFIKYKNVLSTNPSQAGQDTNFVDTDMPLYRLADIYLMYAEATVRGGNGNQVTALGYLNALRSRAGLSPIASYNADYILDERSRELSWELTRRTDLIRFGKFTTSAYVWPWKGGVKDGVAVADYRNLYPIPSNELNVNKNLVQNPGY
ncbi:RagB/SusD family nutrient uptake outer membrane protein [uncultured Chryseobacterium sp.]|uniref:RagB/SusD family nutrient uptake outer membrane protein n=1 Tax=uncultured Chryseobacterium sp. TaxID=259322 RepID=UPI0025F007F3|nr:RagB/SusD family nutrient uptake outer membrane protein [uncultured Chryseobacterium sp.]